jgi:MoaA/NifB/PqqE/SkfB family radical SAM enzyme
MEAAQRLATNLLVKLGEVTHRTHALPLVMFGVTARCNSRCASCDFWKADGAADLTAAEVAGLADQLAALGTRVVVFTGGEPLVRPDVFELADTFRARGLRLHLLTSGLALERFAREVAARFADVTVSLDGPSPELYRRVRGVDGFAALARGVKALRAAAPGIALGARSTLHRLNFRHLAEIVDAAARLGIPRVSFLAADVGPGSFNRAPGDASAASLLLTEAEVREFEAVVEAAIVRHAAALADGRVSGGAEGLRRLPRCYGAHLGLNPFPPVACNAPWMSVYVAPDGAVHPCFFHPAVGTIRRDRLRDLLAGPMHSFRRGLDVARDATCQRCVCNIKTGLRTRLW